METLQVQKEPFSPTATVLTPGSWEVPGICADMWGVEGSGLQPLTHLPTLFLLLTHGWELTKSSATFLSPLCLLSNSIPFTHATERFLRLSGALEPPGDLVLKRQGLVRSARGGPQYLHF